MSKAKIEAPENPNYACTVVRLRNLHPLDGCDNLLGAPLFGFAAIVDKSHVDGELGVVFTAECQLSLEFARVNNLHRHDTLNATPGEVGYLEDTRRVRALKLRGHRSDCLFLPMSCLDFTGFDLSTLTEGDTFDKLNGHDICKKYYIRRNASSNQKPQEKKFKRVSPILFPEHGTTENWYRNQDKYAPDDWVTVTQKLHGTSGRWGRTQVLRPLTRRERIAKRFGIRVDHFNWEVIAGSRKVVKDPSEGQQHYYDSSSGDLWSNYITKIEHAIPENYMVYGELIGFVEDDTPIQSKFTYHLQRGEHELFVYRVAIVNARGLTTDLSWPQVKEFCEKNGLKHVPELWSGRHGDFDPDEWIEKKLHDTYPQALPLSPGKGLVDEGVVVRRDGLTPYATKCKSPSFVLLESKNLDNDVVDIEADQDEEAA